MATRSTRRARPGSTSDKDDAARREGVDVPVEAGTEFEDVTARAGRLGITVEKVLREYSRIAFADLRHIVRWDKEGLHIKQRLSDEDAAPISEIAASASGKEPNRVKLYDKKAALDAIARYLGMFTPSQRRQEEDDWAAEVEEAREELARRLGLLALGGDEKDAAALDEPEEPGDAPA